MVGFILMRFHEVHGRWPFMKPRQATPVDDGSDRHSAVGNKERIDEKTTRLSA